MLPDRSILIVQKLMENAKIPKFKCDILSIFQTMCDCFIVSIFLGQRKIGLYTQRGHKKKSALKSPLAQMLRWKVTQHRGEEESKIPIVIETYLLTSSSVSTDSQLEGVAAAQTANAGAISRFKGVLEGCAYTASVEHHLGGEVVFLLNYQSTVALRLVK